MLVAEHEKDPQQRVGQRKLAGELTGIVHGEAAAASAIEASAVLFDPDVDITAVSESALEFVSGEVPSTAVPKLGSGVIDLLVETELCQSRKEAKRAIAEGGVCLLYTSPSPRDVEESRMPSSA